MSFISRFQSLKLQNKLIFIFSLISLLVLVNTVVLLTNYYDNQQRLQNFEKVAEFDTVIHKLGESTLLYQFHQETGAHSSGHVSQEDHLANLINMRILFEKYLIGLRFGDTELGITGISETGIITSWITMNESYYNNLRPIQIDIESSQNISSHMITMAFEAQKSYNEQYFIFFDSYEAFVNSSDIIDELAFVTGSITILFAIIAVFTFSRSMVLPITKLRKVTEQVANKNLLVVSEGLEMDRTDEIGLLTSDFSKMTTSLQAVISKITDSTLNLSNLAHELASSSEEVNASSEEITSISQVISQGSVDQSNMMVQTVKLVRNFQEMFHAKISDIESASDLIGRITAQVNMLALNASIEAARAGEYGRGFTVVAENIRQLADNTKTSVEGVDISVKELNQTLSESINEIIRSVELIVSISEQTASGAEQANAATEEQSATMEEITATAQELSNLSKTLESIVTEFKIN